MYNVLIHSKSLKITLALENFIYKETEKLFKPKVKIVGFDIYLENDSLMRKNKDNNKAKIVVDVVVPKKHLVVQSSSFDMYEAILLAIKAMKREIMKVKNQEIKV